MTNVRNDAHGAPAAAKVAISPTPAELVPRILSGAFLIVTALIALWLGHDWFGLFWLIAAFGIAYEWQALVAGPNVLLRFAVAAIALGLVDRLSIDGSPRSALILLAAAAVLAAVPAGQGRRVWAGLGVVYPGAMIVAVTLLRNSWPFGFEAVLWLFAVVWGNDIMAYFGGKLIGGPKLWPSISPSKTWAGFLVGNISGALAGLAVSPVPKYAVYCLVLGLLCGVAAQAGDLGESRIKRHFGVKDAGQIIPGHGGVMDRLDGFVAAAVLAACIGVGRYGFEAVGAGLFYW